jgi:hypothetical protein
MRMRRTTGMRLFEWKGSFYNNHIFHWINLAGWGEVQTSRDEHFFGRQVDLVWHRKLS